MGIPNLNEYGLLPSGVHSCVLSDIEDRYCHNERRRELFDGLISFLQDPIVSDFNKIYIDGSFVTSKDEPGDIDVALVVPEPWVQNLEILEETLFSDEMHSIIKLKYHVDSWPSCPPPGPAFERLFTDIKAQDMAELGISDPDFKKGILLVDI